MEPEQIKELFINLDYLKNCDDEALQDPQTLEQAQKHVIAILEMLL